MKRLNHRWLLCAAILTQALGLGALFWWVTLDSETSSTRSLFWGGESYELAIAAEEGNVVTINRMARGGSDLDQAGMLCATPLFRALIAENKTGFSALLDAGVNPNTRHRRGDTLAHIAANKADPFFLEKLLEHGADPDAVNDENPYYPGLTPLFYAIVGIDERPDSVRALIAASADLDFQEPDGSTPLLAAHRTQNYEIAYELLVSGADYLIESNRGDSFVDEVRSRTIIANDQKEWFKKVVAFLESEGIDMPPLDTR